MPDVGMRDVPNSVAALQGVAFRCCDRGLGGAESRYSGAVGPEVGRRQYYGAATSQRTRGTQRRGHSAWVGGQLCAGDGGERGVLGGATLATMLA
jgi:hypothetical protein